MFTVEITSFTATEQGGTRRKVVNLYEVEDIKKIRNFLRLLSDVGVVSELHV